MPWCAHDALDALDAEDFGEMASRLQVAPVSPPEQAMTAVVEEAARAASIPVPDDDAGVSWAPRLLDLKGVARPPTFNGEPAGWSEFHFKFMAMLDLLEMGDMAVAAAGLNREITIQEMTTYYRVRARLLYAILVQTLSGRALAILRLVERSNGLEAWRRLCAEYAPASPVRYTAMLASLLKPTLRPASFVEDWLAWELRVAKYEAAARKPMDNATKAATFLSALPAPLRNFIRISSVPADTYGDLKDAVRSYLARGLTFTDEGYEQAPMEVGVISGPKGKVRNPTPGPGGTQQGWWMRMCRFCGGRHMDAMCARRPGGAGAGRGAQPAGGGGKGRNRNAGGAQVSGKGKGEMSKGKAKGGAQTQFQGYCRSCGRWGHRQVDCRVAPAAKAAPRPQQGPRRPAAAAAAVMKDAEWSGDENAGVMFAVIPEEVCMVTQIDHVRKRSSRADGPGDEGTELLVDSGSFIHVAPPDFAAWLPLTDLRKEVRAATAGGKPLHYKGMRRVTMETQGGPLTLDFHIMDVTRPIISFGELLNEGHALVMSGDGNIIRTKAKRRIPLTRSGNLSYLSVEVSPELKEQPGKIWAVRPKPTQASRRAARRQRDKDAKDQEPVDRPWVLLEWACEPDSRLSAWFLMHGQQAVRLTKDNVDLARPGAVARVLWIARTLIQRGHRALTWAALSCTAWCSWQRVNVAYKAPATYDLEARRAQSIQMVEILDKFLTRLKRDQPEAECAFEWPAENLGWRQPKVIELCERHLHVHVQP